MQSSMSPEAFNVPMCPTVRSANSSMLIAAFHDYPVNYYTSVRLGTIAC